MPLARRIGRVLSLHGGHGDAARLMSVWAPRGQGSHQDMSGAGRGSVSERLGQPSDDGFSLELRASGQTARRRIPSTRDHLTGAGAPDRAFRRAGVQQPRGGRSSSSARAPSRVQGVVLLLDVLADALSLLFLIREDKPGLVRQGGGQVVSAGGAADAQTRSSRGDSAGGSIRQEEPPRSSNPPGTTTLGRRATGISDASLEAAR